MKTFQNDSYKTAIDGEFLYRIEIFNNNGAWMRDFIYAPDESTAKKRSKPTAEQFIAQYDNKTGWEITAQKVD